jgi:phenylalanyl-tRNA synthetase beta chain
MIGVLPAARLPLRAPARRLLGADIADERVAAALRALGMSVSAIADGWQVTPPSWRFDIAIEADLIEEVARFVGFDTIAERPAAVAHVLQPYAETAPDEAVMLQLFAARGYQEAISYGFTDPQLQTLLFGAQAVAELAIDRSAARRMRWSL